MNNQEQKISLDSITLEQAKELLQQQSNQLIHTDLQLKVVKAQREQASDQVANLEAVATMMQEQIKQLQEALAGVDQPSKEKN